MDLSWKAIQADLRSKMTDVTITVAEIREGDELIADCEGWVALEDAETLGSGEVSVRVQYVPDGGISDRIWSGPGYELTVRRA